MADLTKKTFSDCLAESKFLFEDLLRQQEDHHRQQAALLTEACLTMAQVPIGTQFNHNGGEYEVIRYAFQDYVVEAGGSESYLYELMDRYYVIPFFLVLKSKDLSIPLYIEQDRVLKILADHQ